MLMLLYSRRHADAYIFRCRRFSAYAAARGGSEERRVVARKHAAGSNAAACVIFACR
jgi:hypothetical protein